MKIGLVLEGGGMRGLYTIGVLDAMMEHSLWADYVVGVSAGACSGVSYVSRQQYRSYRIDEKFLKDKRYVSIRNFLRTGSMFGVDFIFSEIPKKLDPFDMETFLLNAAEFETGVTDMQTGRPVYFGKQRSVDSQCRLLAASSAIPMFARPVEFCGRQYLDGGTSDPIPAQRALDQGCGRLIIVRTRDRSYRKKPEGGRGIYRRTFRKTPEMARCIDRRHAVYNRQTALCTRLEEAGKAIVLAPERPVKISRFENDMRVLHALYQEGWSAVEARLEPLRALLNI